MFYPHSFLWHYLWIAPCLMLLGLAGVIWRRGIQREFPAFFAYTIFEGFGAAYIYVIDINPSVSATIYWRSYLLFLGIESFVKFVVLGEVFRHLLDRYESLARVARTLIGALGITLVIAAIVIAAYSNGTPFWLISATRILGRSVNVVQCGLIVSIFIFAAHFHLTWSRSGFGIALGFALIASVYLMYWALTANWLLAQKSYLLDFGSMATYHLCVLIWCYYLLVPQKVATTSAVSLPENDLAMWNREVERLLQQ